MKLSFYGAAHEVTGSCHFLEAAGNNILIDCGMQQGQDEKNMQEFPISPNMVDYVLITHAHIDHTGRLPLLSKLFRIRAYRYSAFWCGEGRLFDVMENYAVQPFRCRRHRPCAAEVLFPSREAACAAGFRDT